jgi:hypothetical protein
MKYSVLGFGPLEMIEGCLPCTWIAPTGNVLIAIEYLTYMNRGRNF